MGTLAGQAFAETPKTDAVKAPLAPQRSVFTQPAKPSDGRDPFFPESSRPYESANASASTGTVVRAVEPTTLAVKGFSVVNGRPVVIINNHSFMAGDEGDVRSTSGTTHIRCIEIQKDVVTIEINGARRQIHF